MKQCKENQCKKKGIFMRFIIFLVSIYAFLETIVIGYIEFKDKNKKLTGTILFLLAIFCLVAPNLVS